MDNSKTTCNYVLANGRQCQAKPRKGDTFCAFHRPGAEEALRASRQRGGRSTARKTVPLTLDTVRDVAAFLADTMQKVRSGRMDAKIGNTLAVLASTLLRAMETGQVEARIADLENRLLKGLRP